MSTSSQGAALDRMDTTLHPSPGSQGDEPPPPPGPRDEAGAADGGHRPGPRHCVARAQAGVLLRRLKFALPGWAQAEKRRRKDERDQAAQRAAQARAYSGEGHSEEWRFEFSRPYPH